MKKAFVKISLSILIALITSCSINAQEINTISPNSGSVLRKWKIAKDEFPFNSIPVVPDSLWKPLRLSTITEQQTTGNWIISTKAFIKDSMDSKTVLGIFPFGLITAYEIYWDGVLVLRNGTLGRNNREEQPGTLNTNMPIPAVLTNPGEHTIIVRISNSNNSSAWKWYYGFVEIAPFSEKMKDSFENSDLNFLAAGIVFIPFLFNLFLYFARNRKTEHLLFSLICLLVILDSSVAQIGLYSDNPTTYIHFEYNSYYVITILFSIMFPLFFLYVFAFSKKYILPVIVLMLGLLLFYPNPLGILKAMSFVTILTCSIITIWALFLKREESLVIFIGLCAAWIAYVFNIAFAGLASVMVICTSFSIARQFARKEKREKEALLKSALLENQLLKKNINPHFILNTLTSVIVWLRRDPKSAIQLVEALADEFRTVMRISPLKQISIKEEIDLCRTHLKIMSFRKGADYKLVTADISEEETIPPMIFHTLTENGLTHGFENKQTGTFTLKRIENQNSVQFVFTNDGEFTAEDNKKSTGFGLQYIKGRLEENYPGKWEINSNMHPNGWETIITIRDYHANTNS